MHGIWAQGVLPQEESHPDTATKPSLSHTLGTGRLCNAWVPVGLARSWAHPSEPAAHASFSPATRTHCAHIQSRPEVPGNAWSPTPTPAPAALSPELCGADVCTLLSPRSPQWGFAPGLTVVLLLITHPSLAASLSPVHVSPYRYFLGPLLNKLLPFKFLSLVCFWENPNF